MKVNHLLYKVDNLEESVEYFTSQGFLVEYGRKKNPYNALIYFPEGPYIELIHNMNMPKFLRIILKLFGKKEFAEGMIRQENAPQGFIRLCFECQEEYLEDICDIYKKNNVKIEKIKVRRTDTYGRKLVCNTIFPEISEFPFVKTLFSGEMSLRSVEHPNGACCIKSFEYGVSEIDKKLLEDLNSDPIMKTYSGVGIKRVLIETNKKDSFEFK